MVYGKDLSISKKSPSESGECCHVRRTYFTTNYQKIMEVDNQKLIQDIVAKLNDKVTEAEIILESSVLLKKVGMETDAIIENFENKKRICAEKGIEDLYVRWIQMEMEILKTSFLLRERQIEEAKVKIFIQDALSQIPNLIQNAD